MEYTETEAIISECGQYRYMLRRVWDIRKPACLFIGLNPSTADATEDDPTIRRCVGFADSWGCGTLVMANLFAFRATEPKNMIAAKDKEGSANNEWICALSGQAKIVVAAWGANGSVANRGSYVKWMLNTQLNGEPSIQHLGLTKSGQPKHPLYLRADTQLQNW